MVVCVTSRRISRTQIKDVYEGKSKETDFETVLAVWYTRLAFQLRRMFADGKAWATLSLLLLV